MYFEGDKSSFPLLALSPSCLGKRSREEENSCGGNGVREAGGTQRDSPGGSPLWEALGLQGVNRVAQLLVNLACLSDS